MHWRVFVIYIWFGLNRTQEWSALWWRWKHSCKCTESSVDQFTHTSYTLSEDRRTKHCFLWALCSPQTRSVRRKISAPRTESALRSRDPPQGVLISQLPLLSQLGLCSPTKVNINAVCVLAFSEDGTTSWWFLWSFTDGDAVLLLSNAFRER